MVESASLAAVATALVDCDRVLELINLARGTYGVVELERLLPGEPLSASFCPVGRSLRRGAEDWLFAAIGTKHLRLWTFGKDSIGVARAILTAWGMPHHRLKRSTDGTGFVVMPLPSELTEFVSQFDHGLLPDYQNKVERAEIRRLRELALNIPSPRRPRKASVSDGGQPVDLSGAQANIWKKAESPPGLLV